MKEIDSIDFTTKDEKEQKQCFDICTESQKITERTSTKIDQIRDQLDSLSIKMKPLILPDELKWKNWTGSDFRKCV